MAYPLYRRIADDLRGQIETGQLEPGSQLPPEEKLGELFNASRNTIRDAIKFLSNLSLVETRAGQGTFVVDPRGPAGDHADHQEPGRAAASGADSGTSQRRHPRSDIPTVELDRARRDRVPARSAEGTPVVSRHERRFIRSKRAGQPAALQSAESPSSMQTSFDPRFALKGAERLLDNEDIKRARSIPGRHAAAHPGRLS